MRAPRIKPTEGSAVYHCLSRVVDRSFRLGPADQEQFVRFLREYEGFCGVRVWTYCVMSNHFHVLVEVPARPSVLPTAEELVERLRGLSCSGLGVKRVEQRIASFRALQDVVGEREYLEQFFRRMWDVSQFMKLVKQRFSRWYNRDRGRKGTLWEERFRSVLVENQGEAAAVVAAYVDLNPVRAGMVAEPQEYRWSGYGEASAGQPRALAGVQAVMRAATGQEESERKSLERYRMWLYGQGEERAGTDEQGQPLRKGFKREEVLAVIRNQGVVTKAEYLRCRIRYFAEGVALGSRAYVEGIFRQYRDRFDRRRTDGARPMEGWSGKDLFAMRSFGRDAVG